MDGEVITLPEIPSVLTKHFHSITSSRFGTRPGALPFLNKNYLLAGLRLIED